MTQRKMSLPHRTRLQRSAVGTVRARSAAALLLIAGCLSSWQAVAPAQEPDRAPGSAVRTGDLESAATSVDGSAGDPAVAQSVAHPETYLDFALAGGYLMIPIALASVLLVAFFAERLLAMRRSRVLPPPFVAAIEAVSKSSDDVDTGRVEAVCASHPSSAARILRAALARLGEPREEIEQAVNNAAQREIHSLRKYTRLFAIIAAVAPLIGLLGTVIGMIQAFREVAIEGLGSGQALAPGIYKALVTTAGGLLVAIPALIAYHWLRSRIDNYVHSIDNLVVDFVESRRRAQPAPDSLTE